MELIYRYFNKKFKIGDFFIEVNDTKNVDDNYITYNFNSFLTQSQNKKDFQLNILTNKENNNFCKKRKINTYIYEEYEDNYIFDFNYSPQCHLTYRISKDWKIWTLINNHIGDEYSKLKIICDEENEIVSYDPKQHIFSWINILGNIYGYSILNKEAIMLHGVIIEYKGQGIIISAKSGTGKTTHARIWRDYKNAFIINGDRCICRKNEQQWYAYGSPWCGTSGECMNRKVPIKAIVMLEQSPVNKVDKLNLYDASLKLIERAFAPTWEPDLMNKAFDIIENIANDIPVLKLQCRPDLEAVEVLEKALEELK